MAYIGNAPANRFVAPKAASVFSGDGSTTAFTLDHAVGSDEDILVSVDGVIQEPSVAYAVSNGTTLTFTAAPSSNSGNNIFVYYLFRTVGTVSHPSNNALTATNGNFTGTLTVVDDVSIEGSTPTLTLADTDVSNNKVELNYDEFLTLDIDPNNVGIQQLPNGIIYYYSTLPPPYDYIDQVELVRPIVMNPQVGHEVILDKDKNTRMTMTIGFDEDISYMLE